MGTEVVFVIIYPVAFICFSVAIWSWFSVASRGQSNALGYITGYGPIVAGFAVSMLCLMLITYIDCNADFTSLIEQGYYTEPQRSIYLPARVVGQGIVSLIFVLPFVCLMVVPYTKRLIESDRLTLRQIVLSAAIGWLILSLAGWVCNLALVEPVYKLSYFLGSAGVSILAYGLPIPVAALLFFRGRSAA